MKELLTSSKKVVTRLNQGYYNMCRRAHISLMLAVGVLLSMVPGLSHATPTLGDIGNNAGDQSTGMTSGALRIAAFIGVVMVIIAFVKGRTARQQGEGIGAYVAMGIFGALLFAVPTLISVFNISLLGTDASQSMQGQIIQ